MPDPYSSGSSPKGDARSAAMRFLQVSSFLFLVSSYSFRIAEIQRSNLKQELETRNSLSGIDHKFPTLPTSDILPTQAIFS